MGNYISDYLIQGVFGSGNKSFLEFPHLDPMYKTCQSQELKWIKSPREPGFYRVHYMHCAGLWIDRVHLEYHPCGHDRLVTRGKMDGYSNPTYADQIDAEWMLIPLDFAIKKMNRNE